MLGKYQDRVSLLFKMGWLLPIIMVVAFCAFTFLFPSGFSGNDERLDPLAIIDAKKQSEHHEEAKIEQIQETPKPSVPPAVAFAGKPQGTPKDKRIAIIMTDVGVNEDFFQTALDKLPPHVTFAIRADAPDLQNKINKSREKGHEVFLMIPMEPDGYPYNDPGSDPLLSFLDADENLGRIKARTGQVSGVVGIVPFMGQAFTRNPEASEPIAKWLVDSGYMFLDMTSVKRRSSMADAFVLDGGKYVAYPSQMEDCMSDEQLKTIKLDYIETVADRERISVGVITCVPKSIDLLAAWFAGFEKKKLILTPVSSTVIEEEVVAFQNQQDNGIKQAEIDDNNNTN